MKQQYLVIRTSYFVDGHGEAEVGSVVKMVSDNEIYQYVKKGVYYGETIDKLKVGVPGFKTESEVKETLNEAIDEDPENNDGYNCEVYKYKYRKITEAEAESYQQILNAYNKIK